MYHRRLVFLLTLVCSFASGERFAMAEEDQPLLVTSITLNEEAVKHVASMTIFSYDKEGGVDFVAALDLMQDQALTARWEKWAPDGSVPGRIMFIKSYGEVSYIAVGGSMHVELLSSVHELSPRYRVSFELELVPRSLERDYWDGKKIETSLIKRFARTIEVSPRIECGTRDGQKLIWNDTKHPEKNMNPAISPPTFCRQVLGLL